MKSNAAITVYMLALVGVIFFAFVVFLFTMADDGTGYNADKKDEEENKTDHTSYSQLYAGIFSLVGKAARWAAIITL
jgi:formate/nitrite transporter FocA (FNT family)